MMTRNGKRESGKKEAGQVTLEYFILLTILAVLTLLSVSTFFSGVRNQVQDFTGDVNDRMLTTTDS